MDSSKKNVIPQVGRAISSESHSAFADSPTDSGGGGISTKAVYQDTPNREIGYTWCETTDPTVRRSSLIRTPPKRHLEALSISDEVFETPGDFANEEDRSSFRTQSSYFDEELNSSSIYQMTDSMSHSNTRVSDPIVVEVDSQDDLTLVKDKKKESGFQLHQKSSRKKHLMS